MELTGRLDRNSGVGVPIKLYEAKVYDTVADLTYIETEHVIAKNAEPEEEPAEEEAEAEE